MAQRTPIRAIRAKCIDCCAGQKLEVRLCRAVKCPLYEYRMGHRPKNTALAADSDAEGFCGQTSPEGDDC